MKPRSAGHLYGGPEIAMQSTLVSAEMRLAVGCVALGAWMRADVVRS